MKPLNHGRTDWQLCVVAMLLTGCAKLALDHHAFDERDPRLTARGFIGVEQVIWPVHRLHLQTTESVASGELEAWRQRMDRIEVNIETIGRPGFCRPERPGREQLCYEVAVELPLLQTNLKWLKSWFDLNEATFYTTRTLSQDFAEQVSDFEQLLRRTDGRAVLLLETMGGGD